MTDPTPPKRHPLEVQKEQYERGASNPPQPRQVQVPLQFTTGVRVPYLTYALLGMNVVIFVLMFANQAIREDVLLFGWSYPPAIFEAGEYYRLFTAMFLHGDPTHLLFNMLALYYIGTWQERAYGPLRFGLIYFLGGLAGSILSVVLGDYQTPSIGASGAIFAIFGAEIVFFYLNRQTLGAVAQQRLRSQVFMLGINLVLSFAVPRIDAWGHIGGLLAGLYLGWFIVPQLKIQRAMHEGLPVAIAHDKNRWQSKWVFVLLLVGILIGLLIVRSLSLF